MELMMKSLFVVAVILFVENSQVLTDDIDSSCSRWWPGRIQNGTSGVITSPNYPGNYGDNLFCRWRIDTPQNMILEISFDPIFEVDSNTSSGYCYRDTLYIYVGYSTNVYCGNTAPPTRYYSGEVDIQFRSDNSSSYHKGFKLLWWFVKVDSCSKTPIIQNGTSGVISSPNYPNGYYTRLDCRWLIQTPENTVVEISFDSHFQIEPKRRGSSHCYDALTIKSETVNEYCGYTTPPTRVYSGRVIIQFRSDNSSSYKGFKLVWRYSKVDSTCSATPRIQNGTSGVITSPNHPGNYGYNLYCRWEIVAPENTMVEISFDSKFRLFGGYGGCYDALTIKSETVNVYCGNTAPPTRYYFGRVIIKFKSDSSISYSGFKLLWRYLKVVDSRLCSKTPIIQNGTSGVITSPNHPNNYYRRLDCRWLIQTPENTVVEISFHSNFHIQTSKGRCYDALTIKSESVNEYCNYTAPPTRVYSGRVIIQFRSDASSESGIGFKLFWRHLKVDSCSKTPIIQNGRSGVISSPNYPENYYHNLDCRWLIAVPGNTIHEISFDSNFQVQPNSNGSCSDALTIKNETGSYQYCGSAAPGNRSYTGNIRIQFTSDNSRSGAGFILLWRVIQVKDTDTDTSSFVTVVIGIGFLFIVIVIAIATVLMLKQRRILRNRNTGNNTTDPGAMYYQPSSSGVGGRIYTTQDGIYEDIDDGEIYDDVDIVDVVVAGVSNVTDDDVDVRNVAENDVVVRNATDDDVDVRSATDDNVDVWNSTDDDEDVWNSTDDDVDDNLVADVRNPPEDDYVGPDVRNPPEDEYVVPDVRYSTEDTYIVAGVRNPPEDTYIVAGVRNPPEDTYIVAGVRNPPEDTYIVALKPTTTSADDRISPEDTYVGPDVRNSTEDTYIVAGVRNPPEDDYVVVPGVRNPPEDTYVVPDARNSSEDTYVVAGGSNPTEVTYIVAGVRNPPEDDYVVVAGVRNPPEDTYVVPDIRNTPEDDYVGPDVMNPPEDTYVFAGVSNPTEDTYIVAGVRNPPEDDYVVVAGVRNPPEDTYVVPDIRNTPEDTYIVPDGIRPQLDDNGTMD
ncbi:cubilin-like [Tubulanus polymorphus]|uniref:cubilin-like n=1 Tax=Tubulanus polymorphus TaxID=672921 RepID=UPI003DA54BB1